MGALPLQELDAGSQPPASGVLSLTAASVAVATLGTGQSEAGVEPNLPLEPPIEPILAGSVDQTGGTSAHLVPIAARSMVPATLVAPLRAAPLVFLSRRLSLQATRATVVGWLLAGSLAGWCDEPSGARYRMPMPSRTVQLSPERPQDPPPVLTTLQLEPTGRWIIAAGDDHLVRVLDAENGQVVRELRGHRDWVGAAAVAPDGNHLATAGNDHQVVLWDLRSGAKVWTLQDLPGAVAHLRFNHGGDQLAVIGFSQPLHLLRASDGAILKKLACPCRDMRALDYSPDDQFLAGGGRNGRVRLWNVATGEELLNFQAHAQRIRALVFDTTGEHLITASEDRSVKVWQRQDGSELFQLAGVPGKVLAMTSLPNGRLATACSDNVIRVWDLSGQRLVSQLRGHQGSVAALDANDAVLVSSGYDATLRIWPVAAMEDAVAVLEQQRAAQLAREATIDNATRETSVVDPGR